MAPAADRAGGRYPGGRRPGWVSRHPGGRRPVWWRKASHGHAAAGHDVDYMCVTTHPTRAEHLAQRESKFAR
eukprot:6792831-Prymnesium_polylepis.1